jgi:hypothetical protein
MTKRSWVQPLATYPGRMPMIVLAITFKKLKIKVANTLKNISKMVSTVYQGF